MQLNWTILAFEELSPLALYQIIQLRNEVFVVEQNCVFQDADGKDQLALHLMGKDTTGTLVAYARLFRAGVAYDLASIGRVVTAPQVRKNGVGKLLMQQAIRSIETQFGPQPIKIGAQQYLQKFYESFGFRQSSELYLEDGIPHIEMIRP